MTSVNEWMSGAPERLAALIRGLAKHHRVHWEAADYSEEPDQRLRTDDLGQAQVVSSLRTDLPHQGFEWHAIVVDVDTPAWLIPSSTEGHSHLYVNVMAEWGALVEWLDASVEVGLLEPGYVAACKARGMTTVRLPWVRKGEEPGHEEGLDPSTVFVAMDPGADFDVVLTGHVENGRLHFDTEQQVIHAPHGRAALLDEFGNTTGFSVTF